MSYETIINEFIKNSKFENNELGDAMYYSLNGNGKRVRPVLFMILLNCFGYNPLKYLDIALAIEYVHTYSIVHDDLPILDNDDYRRGKLTTHKKYGSDLALLVGDALLSDAFGLITRSSLYDAQVRELINELSLSIGSLGLVKGQFLDVKNKKDLSLVNSLKTGKLFDFVFKAAIITTNNHQNYTDLLFISSYLGEMFQYWDDLKDHQENIMKHYEVEHILSKIQNVFFEKSEELIIFLLNLELKMKGGI